MKTYRTCLLLIVCALFCALPARANDLELGMKAFELGYVRRAIELWKPLAEQGDVEAQFALGVIYNDAVGVPQDFAEANYWFLSAAEQGYAPAQYNLGNAYKNATGFSEDAGMAVIWWRKAAEQDFAPAQFNLGTALIEGFGVPRDAAAGREWYRRAAVNGHPFAQRYLDELAEKPSAAGTPPTVPPARRETVPEPGPRASPPPAAPTATGTVDAAPQSRAQPRMRDTTAAPESPVDTGDTTTVDCRQWLETASANTYTVQLMASREIASAQAYVTQHELDATAICSYAVKGRFWHALLYGQYTSAASARAALAALTAEVRADGAYIRRIQEIRTAVGVP